MYFNMDFDLIWFSLLFKQVAKITKNSYAAKLFCILVYIWIYLCIATLVLFLFNFTSFFGNKEYIHFSVIITNIGVSAWNDWI